MPKFMRISSRELLRAVILISAIAFLYIFSTTRNMQTDNAQIAGEATYWMPKIGADTLADPENYAKVPIPTDTPAATDNISGNLFGEMKAQGAALTAAQPARSEKFANSEYGFSLFAPSADDLKDISFDVIKSDGTIAGRYLITLADNITDRDGNPVQKAFTEEYLFKDGITKVDFYYSGSRNFEIKTLDLTAKSAAGVGDEMKTLGDPNSDPTGSGEYKTKFFQAAGLNIITRAQWGAPDDNLFAPGWVPPYYQVNRIVVHHTATGVDMSNPANTVYAIWRDHSLPQYRDWGDIGYNYLIDPYGNIYEGRAGGNGVRGNHAPPNENSIGISLLGDYTSQLPTQAALDTLAKLTAYLADVNKINLTLKNSFVAGDPMGLYPHRAINATGCPGNRLNEILPQVRDAAQGYLNTMTGVTRIVQEADQMVDGKDFVQGENMAEMIINTEGLSANLITKLSNPSTRLGKAINFHDRLIYTVPKDQVKQLIAELRLISPLTKAQPNYIYKKTGSWVEVTPEPGPTGAPGYSTPLDEWNDTLHWNLDLTNTREAWYYLNTHISPTPTPPVPDLHVGLPEVKIAVIDTGVAYEDYNYDAGGGYDGYDTAVFNMGTYDNPELINLLVTDNSIPNGNYHEGYDRQYFKSPELSSDTFVDGYDVGQDFLCLLREDVSPWPGNPSPTAIPCNDTEIEKIGHANDEDGHGTFITSIIAATVTDNSPNVILGISPGIKIVPIKVSFPNNTTLIDPEYPDNSYRGVMTTATVAWGVDYADLVGAKVINLSLGAASSEDDILYDTILDAYNNGVTIISASGNHYIPEDYEGVFYPAIIPEVIAVGASNAAGTARASYSNYGSELDVVAPVGDGSDGVTSSTLSCFTDPPDGCDEDSDLSVFPADGYYIVGNGTSFAVPQVVAQVALIDSIKADLTPDQIWALISSTSTDLGSTGWDQDTGNGLINLYQSIEYSDTVNFPTIHDLSPTSGKAMGGDRVTVNGNDFQNGATVKLEGLNALDVQFINSSQITFLSPVVTTGGPATLEITNPDDMSVTKSNAFVYSSPLLNFSPTTWYSTNSWIVNQTKFVVAGDFNGDGKDEIATMYDYGSNDMGINVFTSSTPGQFTWSQWYRSGINNWGVPYTKYVTAGDFNDDGKDEIAAMYDYGSNDMGINVFSSSVSGQFTWSQWYRSGRNNWGVPYTKYVTAGDFNADDKDEIGSMYDYGSNDMGINVFTSPVSGQFTWSQWYRSGRNNWGVPYTKYVTAGDFNADDKDEIGSMYDYGSNDMGINVFTSPISGQFTWSQWYRSGKNNWGVPYTKYVTTGDFNADSKDEMASMYDYGTNDMALNIFHGLEPDPGQPHTFNWSQWYRSGPNNWGVPYTKFVVAGDFDLDGKSELATMYDYGTPKMGILIFE